MPSYQSKVQGASQAQGASQKGQVANQNITKDEQGVKNARAQEATRRAQGKPPARTP